MIKQRTLLVGLFGALVVALAIFSAYIVPTDVNWQRQADPRSSSSSHTGVIFEERVIKTARGTSCVTVELKSLATGETTLVDRGQDCAPTFLKPQLSLGGIGGGIWGSSGSLGSSSIEGTDAAK